MTEKEIQKQKEKPKGIQCVLNRKYFLEEHLFKLLYQFG